MSMNSNTTIQQQFTPLEGLTFTCEMASDAFRCEMEAYQPAAGITHVEIRFRADALLRPASTRISWQEPMDEIHFKWNPSCFESRFLDVSSWSRHQFQSRVNQNAPVICLHKINGENTVTFALSDALHATILSSSTSEYGYARCGIQLFSEPWKAISEYTVTLRFDRRRLPMHTCLQDCAAWWDALIPGEPLPVPEAAKTARYCDWYPYHGKFTGRETERQCALASELGIGLFAYEAEWADPDLDYQPDARKYDDFGRHVEAIHNQGMPFILWVAPPFLNPVSRERFAGQLLGPVDELGKIVNPRKAHLDPRYPEVRQYLVETYARLVGEYDVDGLFLDFMPCFGVQPDNEQPDPARDFVSVAEAVDSFLQALLPRLRQFKPDILMEFRQPYAGPHMRRYANIFRAVDCGNCFADNRLRVLDIRLLCGSAIAHADPIMWNPAEPVQSAAMQLTHTLFSVPNVSMNLETLPDDHTAMVRTYLAFWNRHRDVILDGALTPLEPHNAYPVVIAAMADKWLAALYSTAIVPVPADAPGTMLLVNGTYSDHVVLELAGPLGRRSLTVTSCTGETVLAKDVDLVPGLHRIDMPVNGYAVLDRQNENGE